MGNKKDITDRLLKACRCEPGCEGRCVECPQTVAQEAVDEIERLRDELQLAADTARYACDGLNDALMHEGAHMAAKAIEAKLAQNLSPNDSVTC